jgi:serine/threonine protein kinase
MHLAAAHGDIAAIQLLIDNQASVQAKDYVQWSPLHWAAYEGHPEAVQLLLDAKADKEAKDTWARTPLHIAAIKDQEKAIGCLIHNKADVQAADYQEKTPYDLASSVAIKKLLASADNTLAIQEEGRDIKVAGRGISFVNLLFRWDYENIGSRVLGYILSKDVSNLRETCLEMRSRLFQKGAFSLSITPARLKEMGWHRYPRLYPKIQTPNCICFSFVPVPMEAVVQHVEDWQEMARDSRLLIKNVVFTGNRKELEKVCADLPEHLTGRLLLPASITAEEAAHAASASPDQQGYSDEEQSYAKDKVAILEAKANTIYVTAEPLKNLYGIVNSSEIPLGRLVYHYYNYNGEEKTEYIPSNQPTYANNYGVLAPSGQLVYADEEQELSDEEATTQEEPEIIDPGNSLYNSFIGVNKLPSGKIVIGDYLAAGAFGKVYRGQWGDRPVALKQINVDHARANLRISEDEIKEAMRWEVSRLSTANHPNLVQFYGLYQDRSEGYSYLVMEFCEGGTLQGAMEAEEVPWSKRWQWALQITEALAYLHGEGVLHRDLKAENILLDRYGRAKLADLGVAQVDALLQEDEAKVVGAGLHDKRFIAPEHIGNPTLSSKATDVYALGLVFWQIVTGKEPYKLEVLGSYHNYKWKKGRLVEREVIPEDCPESFKELILDCWQLEPAQRPTAEKLISQLKNLGSEFDLDHHCLVIASQKLEKLVHPKRKEGLAYIAPFVTKYAVDEPIESYWSRVETAQAKGEEAKNPPLTLEAAYEQFIKIPGARYLVAPRRSRAREDPNDLPMG